MKKSLLVIAMFLVIGLSAESIEFSGHYRSSEISADWKKKNPTRLGFVGGCIYTGQSTNGNLYKVYSKNACKVFAKNNMSGSFSCEVDSVKKVLGEGNYFMYEGTCTSK